MIEAWTSMPPAQYQQPVSVHVSYMERPRLIEWCGANAVACYHPGLNVVFMPVQCSPTRRPLARLERIDVADLVRNDMSFCGSVKAHEGGHASGWRH
jgi:hypothetical protein